jgi:serine/threonine protein kinase
MVENDLNNFPIGEFFSAGCFEISIEEKYRFLVMWRYSQSLEKVICSFQGEMLPGKMCFVILRQIEYALKFVHKHGYIHGYIKGANIMVNEVNLEKV